MGQAKYRGTKEQRIEKAIAKKEVDNKAKEQALRDWWEALTPEQKEIENKKRRRRSEGEAFICGIYATMLPYMSLYKGLR